MNETRPIPRRVTMTDVARLAGCSQATVSFVLNNVAGAKISEAMRAKVIGAARSLNYAPAQLAHRVESDTGPGQGPQVVGFIADQLATSPEAVVAIDGARSASWDAGHVVMVAQTMNDEDMEGRVIDVMRRQNLLGVVYMTIFTRRVVVPTAIVSLGVPVALLNCHSEDERFPSVVPAETEGGQAAGEALIAAGHRRIGLITGETFMEATQDRSRGFRAALGAAGLSLDPKLVVSGNWSPSSGYAGARRLLAQDRPPTAIFCQNDRMAIGAYEAIRDAGLRIPHDISVVGYDDEEVARHLQPELSTVVLPQRAMGHWAIEALSDPVGFAGVRERMPCTFVPRASIATPRERV